MKTTPQLADEPEAVLTAWLNHVRSKDVRPGDVVGQMVPGNKFVWQVGWKSSLAKIEDITIADISMNEYDEILDAIAKGQFQICATDRLGNTTVLHKATGRPLKAPRQNEPEGGMSL